MTLVLHPRVAKLVTKYSTALPQGLIIDGPTGSGVRALAEQLAASAGSPAFIIEPKKKQKGEWAVDPHDGSVIIDDIRQLYESTRTRQPGDQVYIIDTGDKSMTIAAQNAFLKLLEEPRPGVHFIIATHQSSLLLPTIKSRTQTLTLLPITDEQTTKFLDSLSVHDTTKHTRLAFVGRGRPALMRRLTDDDDLYKTRVAIMTDAKTLLGNDTYEKLTVVQRYHNNRADALTLIDDMNHQLHTIIRSQPDARFAQDIERHLRTRERIAAGGNIRLQLTADVL
jgi:hypothetical protein